MQIGVLSEWRGRGIGAALVNEAMLRFRASGAGFVMLHVNVNNPAASRLYARCGFEAVGQRARYARMLR